MSFPWILWVFVWLLKRQKILCQVCRHKKKLTWTTAGFKYIWSDKQLRHVSQRSTMLDVKSLFGSTRVFSRIVFHQGQQTGPSSRCHHIEKWWNSLWIMINPWALKNVETRKPIHKKWWPSTSKQWTNVERLFLVEPMVNRRRQEYPPLRSKKNVRIWVQSRCWNSSEKIEDPELFPTHIWDFSRKLLDFQPTFLPCVCGVTWIPQSTTAFGLVRTWNFWCAIWCSLGFQTPFIEGMTRPPQKTIPSKHLVPQEVWLEDCRDSYQQGLLYV